MSFEEISRIYSTLKIKIYKHELLLTRIKYIYLIGFFRRKKKAEATHSKISFQTKFDSGYITHIIILKLKKINKLKDKQLFIYKKIVDLEFKKIHIYIPIKHFIQKKLNMVRL